MDECKLTNVHACKFQYFMKYSFYESYKWRRLYVFFLIILTVNGVITKKQVCIIGAGMSGLVAAKYFGEYPDEFETVVFEKNSDVGGLWIYTNSTTVDEHGLPVHSSIYKSLRANSVKAMMTFLDYLDFKGEGGYGIWAKHEDILQYLRNYTNHFKLRQYIQFNTNVINVKPLPNLRWLFTVKNFHSRQRSKLSCDVAVICNGFNVKGYVLKITGIKSFTGKPLHSHAYRVPETFVNQTVVVLGASSSGTDIGIEISSMAKKVYLSHRHKKLPDVFPRNLEQVPGVVAADAYELILSSGTRIRADKLLFCTGYVYDFPFLDESSRIVVDDGKYIRSIYKHLINIERPTMAFIDVPEPRFHFQNPHAQMQYFIAVLRGKLRLPSCKQMLSEARLSAGIPKRKAHLLASSDIVKYYDELTVAAGGNPLPWWFEPGNDQLDMIIAEDPAHFRDKKFVIYEDERRVEFA